MEQDIFMYEQSIGPREATPQDVIDTYTGFAIRDLAFQTAARFAIMAPWERTDEGKITDAEACNRLWNLAEAFRTVRQDHNTEHPDVA